MRLSPENIKFVKRLEKDGAPYEYFVSLKGHDARLFINYENGKTIAAYYAFDRLPASVQKFIKTHKEEVFQPDEGDGFAHYIIR